MAKLRSEVNENLKWKLTDIFSSAEEFKSLLKELEGVPIEQRTARFVSVIACVFPDDREFTVEGVIEGTIDTKANGNGGFGYDPLFVTEYGCFGIVPPEVKNSVSHRARAIAKFKEGIKKYI